MAPPRVGERRCMGERRGAMGSVLVTGLFSSLPYPIELHILRKNGR